MKYSQHTIHLLKPMDSLDLDRVFPWRRSKRKDVFKLITEGMTVGDWLAKVERAGFEKVDTSFLTNCYAKDEPNRLERRLIDLRAPSR